MTNNRKNIEEEGLISLENEDVKKDKKEFIDSISQSIDTKILKIKPKDKKKKSIVESPVIVESESEIVNINTTEKEEVVLTTSEEVTTEPESIKEEAKSTIVVNTVEKEETVLSILPQTNLIKNKVFCITIIESEKPLIVYTNNFPIINENTAVISNAFKNCVITEDILGKKIVQVKYKEEIQEPIIIELEQGIHIKLVNNEKWMSVNKDYAVKLFESIVLKEYREVNKIIKSKEIVTPKTVESQKIDKQTVIPHAKKEEMDFRKNVIQKMG